MTSRKENVDPKKETGAVDKPPKKPYATPRLTVYGTIEKLTKTGGQTVRDGAGKRKSHF